MASSIKPCVILTVTYQDGRATQLLRNPASNWSAEANELRLSGLPVEVRWIGLCERCGGRLPCYCDMEDRG
jgi:hypothetical protein